MKTVVRNLWNVLRRFKMATLLNVLGLSVAFAAFIIIMMQLEYDYGFDTSDRHADAIFRIDQVDDERGQMAIICRPLADAFIQSSPHIVAGTLMGNWSQNVFYVDKEGVRNTYIEYMQFVYPEITQVFDFVMLEGQADALKEPGTVLISKSMAQKIFGDQSSIGKVIASENRNYTVAGVYADFPENSTLKNCLYTSMGNENLHSWNNWNYAFYVRVDHPENAAGLIDNFKKHFDAKEVWGRSWEEGGGPSLCMMQMKEVHFSAQVLYDPTPKTSRQTVWVLLAIAVIIVAIAGINFTNFSTALAPMRIKSINTQKILGSPTGTLRMALVIEAVAIAMCSFLLALGLVDLARLTFIASMVDPSLYLSTHLPLVGGTALLALLTGLLAGLYPAYYMTSFQPALVLKGSFGLSTEGRKLRNLLICVQYIASFSLLIGAMFMYLQNHYMHHTYLGYDKEQLIVSGLSGKVQGSYKAIASQLKSYAGIEDVTFASTLLSSSDQYMNWGRNYHDQHIDYQVLPVDAGFLKVMGIQVSEGRDFREDDLRTAHGAYVFNEAARKKYNLQLEDHIDSARIVGFMPDVKFASFRMEVTPMAFFVWGKYKWGRDFSERKYEVAYIKVKAGTDLREAIQYVRTTLQSFDSDYPFNVRFFDEVLNNLYEKEENLGKLITLFSLIAIFISMVGVFGLVVFDSEYRKKEIGIRKVLGSTTGEILIMFNKTYMRILLLCFVLAAPLAWYGISRWLENFAYKTPMYLWVYVIAFIIVAVITIFTVTFQNWRAANANPVESIKSE